MPRRCPSRSQFSWQGACTPCLADEGYPEWSPAGAHSGGAAGWWRFGVGRALAALGTSPTKICMEWPYLWPTPSSWDGRRSVYSVCSDVACRVAYSRAASRLGCRIAFLPCSHPSLIASSSVSGCDVYFQRVALFIILLNWRVMGFSIHLYFSVIYACLGCGCPVGNGWAVWPQCYSVELCYLCG